jgi:hypothetical protein
LVGERRLSDFDTGRSFEVRGELVDEDECWSVAEVEEVLERVTTGSVSVLVVFLEQFVAFESVKLVRDLAPRRSTVRGIGVRTVTSSVSGVDVSTDEDGRINTESLVDGFPITRCECVFVKQVSVEVSDIARVRCG